MQSDILDKQIEYYRARASEYDQWFLKEVATELSKFRPQGEALELAGGTGWWTQQLAEYAVTMTAIDASPEVIFINQKRLEKYKNKISYL